jgi:hypothetical protein
MLLLLMNFSLSFSLSPYYSSPLLFSVFVAMPLIGIPHITAGAGAISTRLVPASGPTLIKITCAGDETQ